MTDREALHAIARVLATGPECEPLTLLRAIGDIADILYEGRYAHLDPEGWFVAGPEVEEDPEEAVTGPLPVPYVGRE